MTPAQLRKLAVDPRFIAGVYNYCDRWCERCPLSHRSLNYATELAGNAEDAAEGRQAGLASAGDEAKHDPKSKKFWDKLHANFALTLQMIQEEAQRRGLDLNAPDGAKEAAIHERRVRRRSARHQPLASAARDYGFSVQKWLEKAAPEFKAKGVELQQEAALGIGRPVEEAEAILELLEVIRWYHLFIHVKLQRAIGSQAEEQLETDPELKVLMTDGDGSAKIALISIDRSLAAWAALGSHFSEQQDEILDFQIQLARIRQEAEKLFPNARAFVRPGFDEDLGRMERGDPPARN